MVKPILEFGSDPFVRFRFAFKVSYNLYMAVRPLGRDVPNVVHGVSYLQCWDLRRRRVGHWVVFTRIAGRPGCTLSNVTEQLVFCCSRPFLHFQCRDALKRSRIGPLSVPSIAVISIRPNRVLDRSVRSRRCLVATLKDRFARLDDREVWDRLHLEEGCIGMECTGAATIRATSIRLRDMAPITSPARS
jgi:hypothetical protein